MTEGLRVLLIDDSQTFLRHTARFLERQAGIIVAGMTTSPRNSLSLARELRPDVVVTDLSMPEMSGIELIPRLRVALPLARLVVLTWNDLPYYREAAINAGADEFVRKESVVQALVAAIKGDAVLGNAV